MVATQSPPATHEHGLVAALRENPEEVYSWIEQAQLKLVGVTLADLGGSGKANDLERRLEAVFRGGKANWNSWWKKVRPALKDYPNYFAIRQGRYELVTEVERIPVEPLLFKSTWGEWSKSEQWPLPGKRALPGPNPPANVIKWDILNRKGAEPERLIPRAISVAEEFLAGKIRTSPSAQKWLEMLLEGMGRYRQLPKQDSYCIGLGSHVLAQLIKLLFERDSGKSLLLESVKRAITNTGWRKTLASVLWEKYRYSDQESRALLEYLADRLDPSERIALWDEITLASFPEMGFTNRTTDLDRILSFISRDDERTVIIQRIIHRAVLREAPKDDVASFIANSRYAGKPTDESKKLTALVMSALLLKEGQSDLANEATAAYNAALEQPDSTEYNPLISAFLTVSRDRVADTKRQGESKLAEQRQVYEESLDSEKRRVQVLRNEIAAKREDSRLDIRRGMLEMVAETLDTLHRKKANPEELLRDMEAGLEIALRAGGAEWYGKIGEVVEYQPRLHKGVVGVPKGAPVTIISRGALIPGKITGDFVLIKANVNHQPEAR